jgi:superfamily II DNA or RNA helicase
VFAELPEPSESSTRSVKIDSLGILKKVLEGFSLHPFFYILNTNLDSRADPPLLPFSHQAELLLRLAFRRPIRILIGDEIGLGKTIEAILTIKFLEMRDGIKRVLLLVPRILVEQWRSELKRFGIPHRVIERRNIFDLANQGFPPGWYIASIDLVKREEYEPIVTRVNWDVIVVDEAHRVGKVRSGKRSVTQRYELVEKLTSFSERNVILLSATPHRGIAEDYILRLRLIDPYLISGREEELDTDEFYRLTHDAIVIRRTKIDINEIYEQRDVFKKARFIARIVGATNEEIEFNEHLFEFLRDKLLKYYELIGEEPKGLPLLLALIAKRASSSPYAAITTLERILSKRSIDISRRTLHINETELSYEAESIIEAFLGLGFEDYSEICDDEAAEPDELLNRFVENVSSLLEDYDIKEIKELLNLAKKVIEKGDSRLRGVINLIKEHLIKDDKIVLFTEYRDTAEYVYNKLGNEVPEIKDKIALVTSGEIRIAGWDRSRRPSIEDLKQYLKRGQVKLIVSTDIASEGLNLQVANVIINYEPTWSPIKVEQRLGRVWRLGQEKDVTSYTVFLAIKSDRDILDVLYRKLLAWGRSLNESRSAIGEEITIDMMTEEGLTTIPIDTAKGAPRYSEYKALLTYISNGRIGLEQYVEKIINALTTLKQSLEKVGLGRRTTVLKIENLLSKVLGDFRGYSTEKIFRDLLITVANLNELNIKTDYERVFVGGNINIIANDIHDYYSGIISLLSQIADKAKPHCILSYAQLDNIRELHLFKIILFYRNTPTYSETLGVAVKSDSTKELVRGKELLEILNTVLDPGKLVSTVDECHIPDEFMHNLKLRTSKEVLSTVINEVTKEIRRYMKDLERLEFSSLHEMWEPRDLGIYSDQSEYIGTIVLTTPSETIGPAPTPIHTKEVDEIAMKIALEYERKSGRVPTDVSMFEHYDIRSEDPSTGETRYIEVKGRSGLDLEIQLTEPEFRVAMEKKDNYWLYIVYDIASKNPQILTIRDPVNNMRWEEISVKRYRFRPG